MQLPVYKQILIHLLLTHTHSVQGAYTKTNFFNNTKSNHDTRFIFI